MRDINKQERQGRRRISTERMEQMSIDEQPNT